MVAQLALAPTMSQLSKPHSYTLALSYEPINRRQNKVLYSIGVGTLGGVAVVWWCGGVVYSAS